MTSHVQITQIAAFSSLHSPIQQLECNLMKGLDPVASSGTTSTFLIHRNCEVINAYCLRSPSFVTDLLFSNRTLI